MSTEQRLVEFIKQHGNDAFLSEGSITASCVVRYPNGEFHTEWERVEPTRQAVRAWLGY